jgi:zinc/manganese transport system substrate-binding protein
VLTIADVVAPTRLGSAGNPHLWYAVPALPRIARAIERALAHADPKHAAAYRTGLARFDASLAPLRRTVAAIRAAHRGAPVAYTESVPGYLVAAAGLRNLAPPGFTRAIEDGTEPAPGAVAEMLSLLDDRRVEVLLYNGQAVSPITARVRDTARAAGVPVVAVTETLPAGETFQQWQLAQARKLQAALAG